MKAGQDERAGLDVAWRRPNATWADVMSSHAHCELKLNGIWKNTQIKAGELTTATGDGRAVDKL